jgi:hypothetical protein
MEGEKRVPGKGGRVGKDIIRIIKVGRIGETLTIDFLAQPSSDSMDRGRVKVSGVRRISPPDLQEGGLRHRFIRDSAGLSAFSQDRFFKRTHCISELAYFPQAGSPSSGGRRRI